MGRGSGPLSRPIPGGACRLLFDIQVRDGMAGAWVDWLTGQSTEGAWFAEA